MKEQLYLQKNVGSVDRVARVALGTGLIALPTYYGFSPWIIAIVAAVGGAGILEGIIGY